MAQVVKITPADSHAYVANGTNALQKVGSNLYAFVVKYALKVRNNNSLRVFKSTDNGATWTDLLLDIPMRIPTSVGNPTSPYAVVQDGAGNILVFYNDKDTIGSSPLKGVLTCSVFDTNTDTFGTPVISNDHGFEYIYNGTIYVEEQPISQRHAMIARKRPDGDYVIFHGGFFDPGVSPTSGVYYDVFDGVSFTRTNFNPVAGPKVPNFLIDAATEDIYIYGFYGAGDSAMWRLETDSTLTQTQTFTFNTGGHAEFATTVGEVGYFNRQLLSGDRTLYLKYGNLTAAPAFFSEISAPVSTIPGSQGFLPTDYIWRNSDHIAIVPIGNCWCAFRFVIGRKSGTDRYVVQKSLRTVGNVWGNWTVEAEFDTASTVSDNLIYYNYSALIDGSLWRGIGGGVLDASHSTWGGADSSVYYFDAEITAHSSCIPVLNFGDTLNFGDILQLTLGFGPPPNDSIIVRECPDIVAGSSACSFVKTIEDAETPITDCAETIFSEGGQLCS